MRAGTRRGTRWLAGVWAVAVVLAAVVMAGPAQAATSPFTYSSVGWTGTSAIAGTNSAGDLYYWSELITSKTFNEQLLASGQHFTGAPAIGWTGSTVIIAVSQGTGTWHGQTVAHDIYADPAIAWTGKSVVITDTSPQGDLEIWRQAAGARTWSNKQIALALGAKRYSGPRHLANPSIAVPAASSSSRPWTAAANLDYWSQFGPTPWNEQQVAAG